MSRSSRPAPSEPRRPGDQDQRAVSELRELAAAQMRALVTGEDWAAWLRLAARFPGWSFTNLMLIGAQRPGATILASQQEWQAHGRGIHKGEPATRVLAAPGSLPGTPTTSSSSPEVGAAGRAKEGAGVLRLAYMWDVAQTSGPALTASTLPLPAGGGALPGLWDALMWLARREGFAVDRAGCGQQDSQTTWASRRIRVRPGLDAPTVCRALAHELGHVLAYRHLARLPGQSTAGCSGVQKLEADSIAFVVAARLGMEFPADRWPYVPSWAGNDPRSHPEQAILATGTRITRAASAIIQHLDVALFGTPSEHAATVMNENRPLERDVRAAGGHEPAAVTSTAPGRSAATVASGDHSDIAIGRVLLDAERFYLTRLDKSWVPGYVAARGLDQATVQRWRVGYAPAGWTALISHLRRLGYDGALIEAAGLVRRSSRGTLIDHFSDRVMLAVRDERGMIAGFTGRARPGTGPRVPKYLNSPETSVYRKGNLVFGLHEGRGALAGGAVPVIVEGPFDAIAVSTVGHYVGVAPCGTALTSRQIAALATVSDLAHTGVLLAMDGDRAGRDAVLKAYELLLPHTSKTMAAILPVDHDPAQILQASGPNALRRALDHGEPLARVVIDAHLDSWGSRLDHAEGRLAAMRSAAQFIARTLPSGTAENIRHITGGRKIETLDEHLHHVPNPELPAIARSLPAGAACQVVRVADRTGCASDEVTAEVANALAEAATAPKGRATTVGVLADAGRLTTPADAGAVPLAAPSFPVPVGHRSDPPGPAVRQSLGQTAESGAEAAARASSSQPRIPATQSPRYQMRGQSAGRRVGGSQR